MMIIDGKNKILGRLATFVAKKLLSGEEIIIVNSEQVVIKRNERKVKEQYKQKISRGNAYSGPFFPRRPDMILRRTIRGMLPWKKSRGRDAYKRLKCFVSVPEQYLNKKFVDVKEAENNGTIKTMSLAKLSKTLGVKLNL